MPCLDVLEAKDLSACSCKDDSSMGAKRQNLGSGRISALTHFKNQLTRRTKIMVLENVTSGSVQEVSIQCLTASGEVDARCLHASSDDSGYGAIRRHRGWNLACFCCSLITVCLLVTLCVFFVNVA